MVTGEKHRKTTVQSATAEGPKKASEEDAAHGTPSSPPNIAWISQPPRAANKSQAEKNAVFIVEFASMLLC